MPATATRGASSLEGGWDVKKILGTVPVHEDGSALFRVPANTPIFVQPLDAEGKAQQLMRSWYTAMPGEMVSCIGCHEKQNSGPPSQVLGCGHAAAAVGDRALARPGARLQLRPRGAAGARPPLRGLPQRPALPDRRPRRWPRSTCGPSGCTPDFTGDYSPAYMALQRYVRRAGYESDYHMPKPAEYEADTSALVQMLKKGHYNVQLTGDEWERLYTWIDFNVPYPANWRESHRPPHDEPGGTAREVQEAVRQHRRSRRGSVAAAADRGVRAAGRAAAAAPTAAGRCPAGRSRPTRRQALQQAAGPARAGTGPGRRA